MRLLISVSLVLALAACTKGQQHILNHKADLPKELKEASALSFDDNEMWTLSDNPGSSFYRIDTAKGKILQEVEVTNVSFTDAESITADREYIYVGDFGNNAGKRTNLQIIKVKKSDIGKGKIVKVSGEIIAFSYPNAKQAEGKKGHIPNCEAFTVLGDSLYLFSKSSAENHTHIYSLPVKAGTHTARNISSFNANGLITAATLNPAGNEIALLGYEKGHKNPFIWIISGIKGSDFLSGKQKRVTLTNADIDWQTEGITYTSDNRLFISCETTKDMNAGLFAIDRDVLMRE